ncbi:DNA recombination protein RmuC [Nonlabens ulvanivorans]|nr:DNA recombination protein RmuC [Nonlabens ulvanivorans]
MKTRFLGSLNLLESEKSQLHSQLQQQQSAILERDQLRLESGNLKAQLNSKIETQQDLNQRIDKLEKQYIEVNREKNNLDILLAEQRTSFEKANEKHAEAQQEIEKLNEKFTKEFENLANKILDEKSTKFTDQNKKNIEQILNPLQEKILMFEKRVEDTHKDTIERQSILKQQIIGLKELNEQMSKETTNLTKALKGDAKMRGNWGGELVLERVLEKSGLEKGSEYEVQQSFKTEEGKTVSLMWSSIFPVAKK